jgi:hypothetical protein
MPKSARPVQVYDFTAFSRRTPTQQQPGDRIDAQFREHADCIAKIQQALDDLAQSAALQAKPKEPTLPTPMLGPNTGGFFAGDDAGATATAADFAQVAIAWAENMPWTIPGNILAVNAISGDHWSSRWWANKAANLLAALEAGGLGVTAEQVTVTAANTLAQLINPPVDASTTMQVIVNGRVFSGCVSPPPFTVAGKLVTWASTAITIGMTDEVVARYRYAVTPVASAKVPAISLYYLATQGQQNFLLSTPDRFALSYVLDEGSKVQVSRNGLRLMPDDGSGKGGFAVANNVVMLLWPAGADETVIVDVWEPA